MVKVTVPPAERLGELGGIATRGTLLRTCDRGDLDRAVRGGDIVRIARGRYALAVVDEGRRAAARIGGALALTSAALRHGWAVKNVPDRPQVMVTRGAASTRVGARSMSIARSSLLRMSRMGSPSRRSRWRSA